MKKGNKTGGDGGKPASFHDSSYAAQAVAYDPMLTDAEKRKKTETWLSEDSADAWLHTRMFRCLDPFLGHYPAASWLTVGDGRYGKDAHYIEQKNVRVLATDLSDALLVKGKEMGFINDFKKENAESLSFEDASFDFALCKEAYHHFPRPMLALYEMLRVTRQGVVLIEPNDDPALIAPRGLFLKLVKAILIRLGMGRRFNNLKTEVISYHPPQYEDKCNFVYALSERELLKVAMALNLPHVAIKKLNTFYIEGGEFEKADESSAVFSTMREQIARRDTLCKRGLNLATHDVLVIAILKIPLEPALRSRLVAQGYEIRDLPRNPHLK